LSAILALLGRHPPTEIFLALGTLTGSYAAERLARGWYYLGGQNGIPSISPMAHQQSDKNRCLPVSDE
jgi:branched-chain amino acid transport system permease protein